MIGNVCLVTSHPSTVCALMAREVVTNTSQSLKSTGLLSIGTADGSWIERKKGEAVNCCFVRYLGLRFRFYFLCMKQKDFFFEKQSFHSFLSTRCSCSVLYLIPGLNDDDLDLKKLHILYFADH